jgi:hypothetical protein
VAGCCESGDEPSGSCATELVRQNFNKFYVSNARQTATCVPTVHAYGHFKRNSRLCVPVKIEDRKRILSLSLELSGLNVCCYDFRHPFDDHQNRHHFSSGPEQALSLTRLH